MGFCCFQPEGWPCWAKPRRRLGSAQHGHPSGWKRPSTKEPHTGFFFLHNTIKQLKRIYVVCLGKNTGVRTEFLSQAKTTDFLIWCARMLILSYLWPNSSNFGTVLWKYLINCQKSIWCTSRWYLRETINLDRILLKLQHTLP